MSIAIVVAIACSILGFAILLVVAALAMRSFLSRAKTRGVNVLDGVSPEELATMAKIFREMQQDELQLRVQQKLARAVGPNATPSTVAIPGSGGTPATVEAGSTRVTGGPVSSPLSVSSTSVAPAKPSA